VIIIAVVLIIPAQMILPFPYGIGLFFLLIIIGIASAIGSRRKHERREKFAEDTVKYEYGEKKPEESKKDEKSWDGI